MKAKLIENIGSNGGPGYWRLYRCDQGGALPEYVIVSAAVVPISGPETYIFAANKNGQVTDWIELPGSFRGALDHERALRNAGYEVHR